MLVSSSNYQSKDTTEYFEKWQDWEVLSKLPKATLKRKRVIEVLAFRAFRQNEVKLGDLAGNSEFGANINQKAPYQINR